MIDINALIKNTNAYKIIQGDKKVQRLSHAYLILTADADMLKSYLKAFAKLMCCNDLQPCNNCRTCSLTDKELHPDVLFYPKTEGAIGVEEVNSLIEESYLRPIECDKKLFVIVGAENMNASAQNKLLKTLEEPPKNVHILMGATSEFALLPTIKSRVKKLEIPPFDNDVLIDALKEECPDYQKLCMAVGSGDGTVGKALALYGDSGLLNVTELVVDLLINMNSSSEILEYSNKILQSKIDLNQFLSVLELMLRDMLMLSQGKSDLAFNKVNIKRLEKTQKFTTGAIIYALESITEAQKRKKFNMNPTMLVEWLLFQILEGKYKWQKF